MLTAPIATRARLTLYYQLEKICGRGLVTLYNLANGVMFCFLAGAMITVSATAVGVWVDFEPPQLNDVAPFPLPEAVYQSLDTIGLIDAEHTRRVESVNAGWIAAVFAVGLLTAVVAVYGYAFVARVANIAAPLDDAGVHRIWPRGAAPVHRRHERTRSVPPPTYGISPRRTSGKAASRFPAR